MKRSVGWAGASGVFVCGETISIVARRKGNATQCTAHTTGSSLLFGSHIDYCSDRACARATAATLMCDSYNTATVSAIAVLAPNARKPTRPSHSVYRPTLHFHTHTHIHVSSGHPQQSTLLLANTLALGSHAYAAPRPQYVSIWCDVTAVWSTSCDDDDMCVIRLHGHATISLHIPHIIYGDPICAYIIRRIK